MEASAHQTGHPILSTIFFVIASVTGMAGMNMEAMTMEDLQFYDMVLAILLKVVSIFSFVILVALNIGKLFKMIKAILKGKGEEGNVK